ncbi:hypothetical protein [Paraliobacillus ryukyuensis]|uniref:hypothetical protein n=1 Tax=Paraliobacillus ryukyuensis TaxID=200904 RepID=UPI0009A6F882|nr:hypothetical protein [Paraliobacillus ryukyuensis]
MAKNPSKNVTTIKCSCCGKEKKITEFYSSHSPIHQYYNKLPVCKDCVFSMVDETDIRSVQDMLRMIDKPFYHSLWESSIEESSKTGRSLFGTYMKNVVMGQYKGDTWNDSDFNDIPTDNKNGEYDSTNHPNSSDFNRDYLMNKWGFGYTDEEYDYFERKYNILKNNYQEKTSMHTEALLTYIRYRVKEEIATAHGDNKAAKDWGTLASNAADKAKINPSQLSQADLSDGLDTFGQLIRAVETSEDIIPILPQFKQKAHDKVDFALWCYVNYIRDMQGKDLADYQDIYAFYEDRKKEYEEEFDFSQGVSDN